MTSFAELTPSQRVAGLGNVAKPLSVGPAAAYLLLAAIVVCLLGSCLSGHDRLAFRDTSHFYTPLYEYVASRQQHDLCSLWNPHDLCGLPLAGETSTAMFYPPRWLVYALAWSPESAMAWYAALHLIWAGIAVHCAARVAGAGPLGCAIAIVCYPLAGPVLFSVNNVPFLVGASWLPLAFAGAVRLLRQVDLKWMAITSVAFASPTLGGDPQSTVHALLIVAPLITFNMVHGLVRPSMRRLLPSFAVAASLLLSAAIAAPQLAASFDWARQTRRLEIADATDRYDFDVPPWHWAELLIPEASGRLFPTNTRISQTLPGDGRIWVTTLYAGLIPLVLVIDRIRKHNRRLELWDLLLPLGLLLAMAGPYQWLVNGVPGYASFRYPAKWLPLASLGMAVVAARQASEIVVGNVRGMQQTCMFVAAGTLLSAGVAVFAVGDVRVIGMLEALSRRDVYWGPLSVSLACEHIAWSALGVAAIACGLWICLRRADVVAPLVMLLVAVDMFIAARPQIATIDRAAEIALIKGALIEGALIEGASTESGDVVSAGRSMRVSTGQPWPSSWAKTIADEERLLLVAASERGTSFGRWHLSTARSIFNTAPSLRPQRIAIFWKSLDQLDLQTSNASTEAWQRLEAWLGISSRLVVTADGAALHAPQISQAHTSPTSPTSLVMPTSLAVPLVQWHPVWRTVPKRLAVDGERMKARLTEVVAPRDHAPVVETDAAPARAAIASDRLESAEVQIVLQQPEKIQITVNAAQPGLLTIKNFQDGNWRAEIESLTAGNPQTKQLDAYAVDYLFMGSFVPAGRSTVTFLYRPTWLVPAVALAICGCLLVMLMLAVSVRRHRQASVRADYFTTNLSSVAAG